MTHGQRRRPAAALGVAILLLLAGILGLSGALASPAPQPTPDAAHDRLDSPADPVDWLLWTSPHLVHTNWAQSIRPRIVADTADRLHVIWTDGQFGGGIPWKAWDIYYARRGSDGNWTTPTVV